MRFLHSIKHVDLYITVEQGYLVHVVNFFFLSFFAASGNF